MNKLDPELLLAGVYFLMLKGEIIYVGQSEKLLFRISDDEHRQKKWDDVRYITTKTFYWMDDYYFRRYFEQRCIHRFKPKYCDKKDREKYVSLYNFLMRRHLFNQNGKYVDVISNWCGDFSEKNTYKNPSHKTKFGNRFINHFSKNGKLTRLPNIDDDKYPLKGYDQFFRELKTTYKNWREDKHKLYLDGEGAFHQLVDVTLNKEKKEKRQKFQRSFKPLTKKMHN